jgi:hypothetical protein
MAKIYHFPELPKSVNKLDDHELLVELYFLLGGMDNFPPHIKNRLRSVYWTLYDRLLFSK